MTSKLIDHDRYKISYFYKLTSTIVSREICVGYDPVKQKKSTFLTHFTLNLKCFPEMPIIVSKKSAKIDWNKYLNNQAERYHIGIYLVHHQRLLIGYFRYRPANCVAHSLACKWLLDQEPPSFVTKNSSAWNRHNFYHLAEVRLLNWLNHFLVIQQ